MTRERAVVAWFTGMSGAGKSTIATAAAGRLRAAGCKTAVIDGDQVRGRIHKHLSFSREDILENNRLVAELCREQLSSCDVILVPVISPYRQGRQLAREIIGPAFHEVYIKAGVEELIQRDTKGLYRKAMDGKMDNLIGFSPSMPYEEPGQPDLLLRTDQDDLETCVAKLAGSIGLWRKIQ